MTRRREQVWNASKGSSGLVFCNICGGTVIPGDHWDISHVGAPAALGGSSVGVAHRACNRKDGAKEVTPFVAKAKRLWRNYFGISGPGLGAKPLPAGRHSKMKKKLTGEVVERRSQIELHHDAMARRYGK